MSDQQFAVYVGATVNSRYSFGTCFTTPLTLSPFWSHRPVWSWEECSEFFCRVHLRSCPVGRFCRIPPVSGALSWAPFSLDPDPSAPRQYKTVCFCIVAPLFSKSSVLKFTLYEPCICLSSKSIYILWSFPTLMTHC